MEDPSIIEKIFTLVVEGYTKTEIRVKLGLSYNQWQDILSSTEMKQLFYMPIVSPLGLIEEIEQELWSAIKMYNSKDDINLPVNDGKFVLYQRIEQLSKRYISFVVPTKNQIQEIKNDL